MLIRFLALSIVVVGLTGCSSFELLYSFADSYVIDKADRFLEPNDEEAVFIERQTDKLIKWHTREMLPQYARQFNRWADDLATVPVARDDTTRVLKEVRRIIDELIIRGTPFVAEILIRHTTSRHIAKMKTHLAEELAEKHEEMQAPAAERAEARVDSITDNIERMTGTLNEAQRAEITAFVAASAGNRARWLENRAKRQAALVAFLQTRPDKAKTVEFLIQILLRPHEIADPAYRHVAEQRWVTAADLMYQIVSTLSPEQRRETVKNLRDYAADMLKVSREN